MAQSVTKWVRTGYAYTNVNACANVSEAPSA